MSNNDEQNDEFHTIYKSVKKGRPLNKDKPKHNELMTPEGYKEFIADRIKESESKEILLKCQVILSIMGEYVADGSANYAQIEDISFQKYNNRFDFNFYDNEYNAMLIDDEEIEDIIDENIKIFDALSKGYNLQISYTKEDRLYKIIYDGYIAFVYKSGHVKCYIPDDRWENVIDLFYGICLKKIEKENLELNRDSLSAIIQKDESVEDEKILNVFWQKMKKFWNFG